MVEQDLLPLGTLLLTVGRVEAEELAQCRWSSDCCHRLERR